MNTLLIKLVGPMQSWGTRSRFEDRDTHLEPTKSGVIGLVCAALGRDRAETIDDLAALRMGVRVDRPGNVATDYHTAMDVARAAGGTQSTVVSRRHYIADARFWVGLESGDSRMLEAIFAALQNPKWILCLGRKSFPLSEPPCADRTALQVGVSLENALRNAPWLDNKKPLRMIIEQSDGETVFDDQPIAYNDRRFSLRHAQVVDVELERTLDLLPS